MEKQIQYFPAVPYQHITFTMPCEFWNLFWLNRSLLNLIGPLAAECVKLIAKEKGVIPGRAIGLKFDQNLINNTTLDKKIPLLQINSPFNLLRSAACPRNPGEITSLFFWIPRTSRGTSGIFFFLIKFEPDCPVIPGIFLAIHTFGRDLKRNVHIHLSVTLGGLNHSHTQWLTLAAFEKNSLMPLWRARIIKLLRSHYKKGELQLPLSLTHLQDDDGFRIPLNMETRHQILKVFPPLGGLISTVPNYS